MNFKDIGITDRKAKQFIDAGIETPMDLVNYWPKKYIDRSKTTGFLPKETESVIVMHLEDTDIKHYSKTVVEAAGYEVTSKQPVKVVWFNQEYIYHRIQSLIGEDVFVCGRANYIEPSIYSSGYFQIAGPTVFSIHDPKEYRIYPVYKKIKNMSAEYLENSIADAAAALYPFTETLPEPILREMKMVGTPEMVYSLHWPASSEALESALRRKRFNDLFVLRFED